MKQAQQNITLPLGNRGYSLSISQGVGDGSLRGHYVEVALLTGSDEYVNSGRWWVDTHESHGKIYEDHYDDVVTHIDADDLQWVIAKARAWVMERN